MALYSLDIEKRLGTEFWTNRYILDADTAGNASNLGQAIVMSELAFHSDLVTFTRFRVSTMAEGDEVYAIIPINQAGQRTANDDLMPLFNTLRMDFTATSGRPSRKFYRGVLYSNDCNGDAVSSDFTAFAADIEGHFKGVEDPVGIVDPQSQLLTNAVVHPFVQMRQLRRGTRKRASGGIFQ